MPLDKGTHNLLWAMRRLRRSCQGNAATEPLLLPLCSLQQAPASSQGLPLVRHAPSAT
jgi:hypothetical protein